jgi:hypothetical protein
MDTVEQDITEYEAVMRRLDELIVKVDECLEVHKYVMEQITPMLEALSSSPMAKMFFG